MRLGEFFAFARERHSLYLRRQAGLPRPWTEDPILQQYKFTNVFRELDRTTVWFRENVRERMRARPEVLLATVLFRWFNRITTGEAVFQKSTVVADDMMTTPWEALLMGMELGVLHDAIVAYCGAGPYVTGAYMIKTPTGMKKLDGVLEALRLFMTERRPFRTPQMGMDTKASWRDVGYLCLAHPGEISMQDVVTWLAQYPYQGDFLAYEVVTDLRHTDLLSWAPDIDTWAADGGPGARRGAARMLDEIVIHPKWRVVNPVSREKTQAVMREILAASRDPRYWPQCVDLLPLNIGVGCDGHQCPNCQDDPECHSGWPKWEMRDAEHTLCEWDKYERARLGQGRPKAVYR